MESGLEDRNNELLEANRITRGSSLNGVRPRRTEQLGPSTREIVLQAFVSMESGLEDRNNQRGIATALRTLGVSMESGLEDRNN